MRSYITALGNERVMREDIFWEIDRDYIYTEDLFSLEC